MTFKDFLAERKLTYVRRRRFDSISVQWHTALQQMFNRVQQWIEESDTNKLLTFRRRTIQITEVDLGSYDVPVLEVWLGGQWATFKPIARLVKGPKSFGWSGEWSGRVDLTDNSELFEIYRFTHSSNDETWLIRDAKTYDMKKLDKRNTGTVPDGNLLMTTLLDAWIWYEKNRRLLQLIRRLGKKYWNHLPWPILEKDDRFRLLEGKTVEAEAESVLAEFDDLGIFVLFSVFEAVVRIYVHSNVSHEAAGLQHEALKRGAEHLLRNIADGSFYTNVLDLYKGVDHDK